MTITEQAVLFACDGDRLLGILSVPQMPGDTAVVIVVGGPQYRAGSHRQFVLLARRLAAEGYPVLRFDYRGMGDSDGAPRSFEHVSDDVGAAMDAVRHHLPAVQRFALWGLCDGASAALLYWNQNRDVRVAALCLLNPWVRSDASLARTHVKHYYLRRLAQPDFWSKLVRGGVAWSATRELGRNLRKVFADKAPTPQTGVQASDFRSKMLAGWAGFTGAVLLVISGDDYTAREFTEVAGNDPAWGRALVKPSVRRCDLPAADHTLSKASDRIAMESAVIAWLDTELAANDGCVAPHKGMGS